MFLPIHLCHRPSVSPCRASLCPAFLVHQPFKKEVPIANRKCRLVPKFAFFTRRTQASYRKLPMTATITLFQDKDRLYVFFQDQEFFTQIGWALIFHPPYRPDFALIDYDLFPILNKHSASQGFWSDDDIKERWNTFSMGEYRSSTTLGFKNWTLSTQKRKREGDNVEK